LRISKKSARARHLDQANPHASNRARNQLKKSASTSPSTTQDHNYLPPNRAGNRPLKSANKPPSLTQGQNHKRQFAPNKTPNTTGPNQLTKAISEHP
jgi:hypothetical protein